MKIRAHLVSYYVVVLHSALLLALAMFSAGCNSGDSAQARKGGGGPREAVPIQTTAVQRIAIQRQVDISGTLISLDQARVSSQASGVVQQILVEIGQEIQQGQILARLDPRELELAVRGAESALRQTEAQLGIDSTRKDPLPDEQISSVRTAIANRDDARAQLARARRLMSQHLLPQADLDAAETRVRVSEASYQAALEDVQSLKATWQGQRAALELAQKKLSDAVIRAPIAGQVVERLVQEGEFISQNTPVVSIVQMNPLKLRTAVQERYASLIQPKLPVSFSVESYPGETFEGSVINVSPTIDQNTRTFVVEVIVDNGSHRLKPGFFTKGVILTRRDDQVMAVPEEAVSTLAGVSTVYVVSSNKVRPQIISLGAQEGNLFEVIGGLKGDEVLASSTLSQLANGVAVQMGTTSSRGSPSGRRSAKDVPAGTDEGGRP